MTKKQKIKLYLIKKIDNWIKSKKIHEGLWKIKTLANIKGNDSIKKMKFQWFLIKEKLQIIF